VAVTDSSDTIDRHEQEPPAAHTARGFSLSVLPSLDTGVIIAPKDRGTARRPQASEFWSRFFKRL
jgi:hypothetical protein